MAHTLSSTRNCTIRVFERRFWNRRTWGVKQSWDQGGTWQEQAQQWWQQPSPPLLWEATSHLIKIYKSKDLNRKFNNRAVPVHLENLSDLRVGKSFPSMAVMEQRERKIKLQRNKTLHLNKLLYLEKVCKTRGSVWCVLLRQEGRHTLRTARPYLRNKK